MADVIAFPGREVAPDSLPQAGDRHQAYALWHGHQPPMITFVLSPWSRTALRYDRLEQHEFRSCGDDRNCEGECVIRLIFAARSGGIEIIVTGRNLYRLYAGLGQHRVAWLWALPEGRAEIADSGSLIRSITVRDMVTQEAGCNAPRVPPV